LHPQPCVNFTRRIESDSEICKSCALINERASSLRRKNQCHRTSHFIIKTRVSALFLIPHSSIGKSRLTQRKVVRLIHLKACMHYFTSLYLQTFILISLFQKWSTACLCGRGAACIWNRVLLACGRVSFACKQSLESDDEVHKICKFIHFECKNLECLPPTMSIHKYTLCTPAARKSTCRERISVLILLSPCARVSLCESYSHVYSSSDISSLALQFLLLT
jgi:hypothetical protein